MVLAEAKVYPTQSSLPCAPSWKVSNWRVGGFDLGGAVAEVPGVGEGEALGVGGGAAGELHGEGSGAVDHVGGCNGVRGRVAVADVDDAVDFGAVELVGLELHVVQIAG